FDDGTLDYFAAAGIDGMSNIGVQLDPAVGVAGGPVLIELATALIAVARPQMILAAATRAAVGELAAGHGHERAFCAFNGLEVAHDEGVVERDRAEGLEALVFVVVLHELDSDFGDHHSGSPLFCGTLNSNSERRTVADSFRRRFPRRSGPPRLPLAAGAPRE